ncbi:hypothetical protein QBC35DRAFT_490434 [Podospora australis]|uniref:Mid2 domain-containing protein n=1 Tax=Podospora australis TaxID=1536484 RepID=A0AAN7AJ06_9PEZI|nr:hypothetical protein QBC35DRAFT_490434 [Podospora australis]
MKRRWSLECDKAGRNCHVSVPNSSANTMSSSFTVTTADAGKLAPPSGVSALTTRCLQPSGVGCNREGPRISEFPVVAYDDYIFWPLSYRDASQKSFAMLITRNAASSYQFVDVFELPGARVIDSISISSTSGSITFEGANFQRVSVSGESLSSKIGAGGSDPSPSSSSPTTTRASPSESPRTTFSTVAAPITTPSIVENPATTTVIQTIVSDSTATTSWSLPGPSPTGDLSLTRASDTSNDGNPSSMSAGRITGIVVGAVLGFTLILSLVIYCCTGKRRERWLKSDQIDHTHYEGGNVQTKIYAFRATVNNHYHPSTNPVQSTSLKDHNLIKAWVDSTTVVGSEKTSKSSKKSSPSSKDTLGAIPSFIKNKKKTKTMSSEAYGTVQSMGSAPPRRFGGGRV